MRNKLTSGFPWVTLALLFTIFLFSCSKKKDEVKSFFHVENLDAALKVNLSGDSKTYNIQSDGIWKIDIIDGDGWVSVTPSEGSGNGTFTVTIDKNRTSDARMATLAFRADYLRQDESLKIEQEANPDPPHFEIEGEPTEVDAVWQGEDITYHILSNTEWSVIVGSGQGSWIQSHPSSGSGDGDLILSIDPNEEYTARTETIQFIVDGQQIDYQISFKQEGKVDETVIINEDFSWLAYGSPIFYTTTAQARYDTWSAEEKDKGWSSTVNTVAGGGNTPMLYARPGFVVMGKTSYGGDLISPKFSAISGTRDVNVSFKSVPYQTKAGTRDDNKLKIEIIGPGTASTEVFVIDNWPDYDTDPDCVNIWSESRTTRNFTISGATSETQIRFVGQAFDLRPETVTINKNRIFLDDIIVTLK